MAEEAAMSSTPSSLGVGNTTKNHPKNIPPPLGTHSSAAALPVTNAHRRCPSAAGGHSSTISLISSSVSVSSALSELGPNAPPGLMLHNSPQIPSSKQPHFNSPFTTSSASTSSEFSTGMFSSPLPPPITSIPRNSSNLVEVSSPLPPPLDPPAAFVVSPLTSQSAPFAPTTIASPIVVSSPLTPQRPLEPSSSTDQRKKSNLSNSTPHNFPGATPVLVVQSAGETKTTADLCLDEEEDDERKEGSGGGIDPTNKVPITADETDQEAAEKKRRDDSSPESDISLLVQSLGSLFSIKSKKITKERRYGLISHRNCLTGREVVEWITKTELSITKQKAVEIGSLWLASGVLKPLPDSPSNFTDATSAWFGVGKKGKAGKKAGGGKVGGVVVDGEVDSGDEDEAGGGGEGKGGNEIKEEKPKKKEKEEEILKKEKKLEKKEKKKKEKEHEKEEMRRSGDKLELNSRTEEPLRGRSRTTMVKPGGQSLPSTQKTVMDLLSGSSGKTGQVISFGSPTTAHSGSGGPHSSSSSSGGSGSGSGSSGSGGGNGIDKKSGSDKKSGIDKNYHPGSGGVAGGGVARNVRASKKPKMGMGLGEETVSPSFQKIFDAFAHLDAGDQESVILDLLHRQKAGPSQQRSLAMLAASSMEKRKPETERERPKGENVLSLESTTTTTKSISARESGGGGGGGGGKMRRRGTVSAVESINLGSFGGVSDKKKMKISQHHHVHTSEQIINSLANLPCPYFDLPLRAIMKRESDMDGNPNVPSIAPFLLENIFRLWKGTSVEGIFRLSVFANDLEDLQSAIESVNPKFWDSKIFLETPHHAAALFKTWLRSLEGPVIPFENYDESVECGMDGDCNKIVEKLPEECQSLLIYLVSFLRVLLQDCYQTTTLMSRENLGVVFSPGLIRSPSSDPLIAMAKGDAERGFVENLIENLKIPAEATYPFTPEFATKLLNEGKKKKEIREVKEALVLSLDAPVLPEGFERERRRTTLVTKSFANIMHVKPQSHNEQQRPPSSQRRRNAAITTISQVPG